MVQFEFSQEEKDALKALNVEAVVLFGSHARGLAGPRSDADIGVLLHDPRMLGDRSRRNALYDNLYDIFSALVGRAVKRLSNIDIVFLQDEMLDLQLKYRVSSHGVPLYERDTRAFADFRERIMARYADFAPLRHMFNQAILSRI
jgi:predicted nucleotidyltransferase